MVKLYPLSPSPVFTLIEVQFSLLYHYSFLPPEKENYILNRLRFFSNAFVRTAIHLSPNMQKLKVHSRVLHATFFAFCAPFFRFSLHFTPGSAFARKVKRFCGLFFAALIKREIRMQYEKCIGNESFVVHDFRKIPAKCEIRKCIAGLTIIIIFPHRPYSK